MDLINEMIETLQKLQEQSQELSKAIYQGPWKFKDIKEQGQEHGYALIRALAEAGHAAEDVQDFLARYRMIEMAVDAAFAEINKNDEL
jgi:hypothetical protein